MREMIGGEVDLCYNQSVIKPPTGERPNSFAWHQDSYYACHGFGNTEWDRAIMTDASRTFQSWVAVTRTTVANGTLIVLPGRHREGFFEATRSAETGEFVAQLDTSKQVAVELKPGQMLVFSGMLPHASGANTSDETRMVYQFCLAPPGARRSPSVMPVLRAGTVV
jgi:ectoine hydroxylase-related dioxygenase (phytanoyl-CoA dioxygenase family)